MLNPKRFQIKADFTEGGYSSDVCRVQLLESSKLSKRYAQKERTYIKAVIFQFSQSDIGSNMSIFMSIVEY